MHPRKSIFTEDMIHWTFWFLPLLLLLSRYDRFVEIRTTFRDLIFRSKALLGLLRPSHPLRFYPGNGRHFNSSCARTWRVYERQIGFIELSCVSTRPADRSRSPSYSLFCSAWSYAWTMQKDFYQKFVGPSGVNLNFSAQDADADRLQPTRRTDHRPPLVDLSF